MKFQVLQQDLLPVLQAVSRSVGSKSSMPVLDNILLSVEGNNLKIAATNLEIGVIKLLPVEVIEGGELTVPAKTLFELVSGIKQTKLEFESGESVLHISSGKFKAKINGIPAVEFPIIPIPQDEAVEFDRQVLESCGRILFASAVDEGRPVLTGILTQANSGKLDFIATDGFRLGHAQVSLSDTKISFRSLIPRKTFEEVLRVISEENPQKVSISVSKDQNQAVFKFNQTIISSRLIAGNFPAWEKLFPDSFPTTLISSKDELLKSIKLASVFARNESNVITFKISSGRIEILSSAKELGEIQNEIDCELEGEDLTVAFNAKFLFDAINNCPSDQVKLKFAGDVKATLITPVGIEGVEFIVMPVRLS